jgi:Flp pilus assembly protein TadD
MRSLNSIIAFCALVLSGGAQTATAEAEFAAGIAAAAKGDAIGALEYLKRAVSLDPKMTKAYFAIGSFAEDWCGVDDGDLLCELAIDGYQKVTALDPPREDAWKRLGLASYVMSRVNQAESSYRRALSLNACDPEVLGGLAMLDMHAAYRGVYAARVEHKVATQRELINSPFCGQVRGMNLGTVNEGVEFAGKAHELKNKNVDLMSVLSVLHATRAQMQCGDLKSFNADMAASKRWNHLREKAHSTGDQFLRYMPPAPPPPPPGRHWWNLRPAPK